MVNRRIKIGKLTDRANWNFLPGQMNRLRRDEYSLSMLTTQDVIRGIQRKNAIDRAVGRIIKNWIVAQIKEYKTKYGKEGDNFWVMENFWFRRLVQDEFRKIMSAS